MASSSAIADGLVTMLTATSMFGSNMVAKADYSVLERASGSCAVVFFQKVESTIAAFTNVRDKVWTIGITSCVRDTGDPVETLTRVYSVVDKVIACLESDDTVQGNVDGVQAIRAMYDQRFLEAGGATWLPVDMQVELLDLG